MKKSYFRKLLCTLLTLAMALSITTSVFAAASFEHQERLLHDGVKLRAEVSVVEYTKPVKRITVECRLRCQPTDTSGWVLQETWNFTETNSQTLYEVTYHVPTLKGRYQTENIITVYYQDNTIETQLAYSNIVLNPPY